MNKNNVIFAIEPYSDDTTGFSLYTENPDEFNWDEIYMTCEEKGEAFVTVDDVTVRIYKRDFDTSIDPEAFNFINSVNPMQSDDSDYGTVLGTIPNRDEWDINESPARRLARRLLESMNFNFHEFGVVRKSNLILVETNKLSDDELLDVLEDSTFDVEEENEVLDEIKSFKYIAVNRKNTSLEGEKIRLFDTDMGVSFSEVEDTFTSILNGDILK